MKKLILALTFSLVGPLLAAHHAAAGKDADDRSKSDMVAVPTLASHATAKKYLDRYYPEVSKMVGPERCSKIEAFRAYLANVPEDSWPLQCVINHWDQMLLTRYKGHFCVGVLVDSSEIPEWFYEAIPNLYWKGIAVSPGLNAVTKARLIKAWADAGRYTGSIFFSLNVS
jgi:hypothetical protein